MNRLIEKIVFSGLVTAWRFATWPTSRLPSFVNATTEGVVRPPSEFVMTVGSPPSMTATTELVVPKSIPIILLISFCSPKRYFARSQHPSHAAPPASHLACRAGNPEVWGVHSAFREL